jgi:hypothetical protein
VSLVLKSLYAIRKVIFFFIDEYDVRWWTHWQIERKYFHIHG